MAARVAYWAAVLGALLWAPQHSSFPSARAYGPGSDFVFGAFAQWDANWFVGIADHGYTVVQGTSFFPLYPAVTAVVAFVVRSTLVAGVLVSLVSAGVAAVAIARIARRCVDRRVAHDTVLLLALYPIAFVFTSVYSDALFLALAAWSFLLALERRTLASCLLGAAAVLTRPTGLALLPALALLLWQRGRSPARLAPLALLPAALAAYCAYLQHRFGDWAAFVHSEGSFWLRHVPATGPLGGAWAAVRSGYQGLAQLVLHLPPQSGAPGGFPKAEQFAVWNVVQLLVLVAACVLTWVCWQRVGRAAAVYSAATIVLFLSAPADVVPLVSVPRFLLGDFPLFIALAVVLADRPRWRTPLVAGFAALGLLAAAAFARGIWIS